MADPAILKRIGEQGLGTTYYRVNALTGHVTRGVVTKLPFSENPTDQYHQHLALDPEMARLIAIKVLELRVCADIVLSEHKIAQNRLEQLKIARAVHLQAEWDEGLLIRSHSERGESETITVDMANRIKQLQPRPVGTPVYVPIFAWLEFMSTWTDAEEVVHPVWIMEAPIQTVACIFGKDEDEFSVDISYKLAGGPLSTVGSMGRKLCLTPDAARLYIGDTLKPLTWTKDIAQKSFGHVPIVSADEYAVKRRQQRNEAIQQSFSRVGLQPFAD